MSITGTALHLRFNSDPAEIAGVRKAVEQFAAQAGLAQHAVEDLGLCVNEAVANVIRHAYHGAPDRPIELHGEFAGDAVTITLRDWGDGTLPDIVKWKHDPLRPGGLGLPCLKHLLDDIRFEPQPDGMRLRMTKQKRHP